MLSGGERRRLHLVMVLATEPNLLILDEPTNDLDLDTLRSLEAFLDDWPGALVVARSRSGVSRPRCLHHVLAIDPGGSVRRVPGGVAGWLAERSGAAPKPKVAPTVPRFAVTPKPKGAPSQYTVGRQLRETEQAMVKAQKRVDQLAEQLAGLTDHAELHSLGSDLAAAQAELDGLESRWLELAELQHG